MAKRTNKDGDFFLTDPSRSTTQTPEQERQERRSEIYKTLGGDKKELVALLGLYCRIHSVSERDSKDDIKSAIVNAMVPEPRKPRSR